jgi:hypothetical protein
MIFLYFTLGIVAFTGLVLLAVIILVESASPDGKWK